MGWKESSAGVVHRALRAGEYIKQHCVKHPWVLQILAASFLLLTAQAIVQSAESYTHLLWAACLKYLLCIPSLAEQSASDGFFRHLFWERAL